MMKLIFILTIIIIFLSCGKDKVKTEIIPLQQYTKVDDGRLTEIFLITSPPTDSVEMVELLDDYHKQNGRNDNFSSHRRLYIQIREMSELERILLDRDNKLPETSGDLRNEDFLASYFWYESSEGKKECQINFYTERW